MPVFDAIKDGISSAGDPVQQCHGVGFEKSSVVKVSPFRDKGAVLNIAHFSFYLLCW
jgi:hypothetical protein